MPDYVLDAPKTGFGVPYSNWLKKPLKQLLIEQINLPFVKQQKIFNYPLLNQTIDDHVNNKKNNGFLLWKILNLTIWMKKYNVHLN